MSGCLWERCLQNSSSTSGSGLDEVSLEADVDVGNSGREIGSLSISNPTSA